MKTPKLGMSSPSKAVVRVTSFCNGTTSILLKIILIGNFPKLPSIKKNTNKNYLGTDGGHYVTSFCWSGRTFPGGQEEDEGGKKEEKDEEK